MDPSTRKRDAQAFMNITPSQVKEQALVSDQRSGCEELAVAFASNKWISAVMGLLTVYALFGDDVRVSSTASGADPTFDIVTVACLLAFASEIVIMTLGKEGYFLSFFFWLDLVATATLPLDLTDVAQAMQGGGEGGEAARAGRAGRAGTKAGRIIRVIRLVRLIRILKLYKHAVDQQHMGEGQQQKQIMPTEVDDDEDLLNRMEQSGESRVGKQLSEVTTRYVICMVLAMLFVLPQFQVTYYAELNTASNIYGLDVVTGKWGSYVQECVRVARAGNATEQEALDVDTLRSQYERSLLLYLSVHNWHSHWGREDGKIADGSFKCSKAWCSWSAYMQALHVSYVMGRGQYNRYYDADFAAEQQCYHPQITPDRWVGDEFSADPLYAVDLGPVDAQFVERLAKAWNWGGTRCRFAEASGGLLSVPAFMAQEEADRTWGVPVSRDFDCPEDLRFSEVTTVYSQFMSGYIPPEDLAASKTQAERDSQASYFMVWYDDRPRKKAEGYNNILQTLFVCVVLGLGSMMFSKDANTLVLQPIERMMERVKQIAKDPLEATKISDEELRKEAAARRGDTMSGLWAVKRSVLLKLRLARTEEQREEPLETAVLEKTITKIGGLLALGFGQAGGEIIAHNMGSHADQPHESRRVQAVFAVCTVRHFTDAIEILQDTVMIFVNQIAELVHGIVDEYHGAPNRNIGDAFLSVWRVDVADMSEHDARVQVAKVSDMAVLALTKICAAVSKSPVLGEYRYHPALLTLLPDSAYRVSLGFGLHYGWAIEGAIGSDFKIDASYLSPHVNMAELIEGSTGIYDVTLCMSQRFAECCSPTLRQEFRILDHVLLKGFRVPFHLYALDLDPTALEVVKPQRSRMKLNKYKTRINREMRKRRKEDPVFDPAQAFLMDPDVKRLRSKFPRSFFLSYEVAFRNYDAGEWDVARDMFRETQDMIDPEDGPSHTLLQFMAEHCHVPPANWAGHRVLAVQEVLMQIRAERRAIRRGGDGRGSTMMGRGR